MGLCIASNSQANSSELINYTEELRHLFVITVLVNPSRSKRTFALYHKFKKEIEIAGARLVTVEYVCDGGPFALTIPNYEPVNIQIKSDGHFFQKENLINIAANMLPLDAKYIVWCDFEVEFLNPSWAYDIIKCLKESPIIQPFDEISVLDHLDNEMFCEKSFAYYMKEQKTKEPKDEKQADQIEFQAMVEGSGYAWAMTKEAFEEINGLLDCSLLGNGDRLMAYCLAQRSNELEKHGLSSGFMSELKSWQKKIKDYGSKIGCLSGKINLHWSGVNRQRSLLDRYDLLAKHQFDPKKDLDKSPEGVFSLKGRKKPELAEELRKLLDETNQEMY